jgi:hypothetical protein
MTATSVSPPPAVKLARAAGTRGGGGSQLRQERRPSVAPGAQGGPPYRHDPGAPAQHHPDDPGRPGPGPHPGRRSTNGPSRPCATPSSTWRSWAPTACPESALWSGDPPVRPQPCAGQRPRPIARAQCRSRRRGQGGGPTKRRGSGHDSGSRPGSGSDGSTGATFGHRHARSARSPTRRWSLRRSVGRAGGELPPHGRPPSTARHPWRRAIRFAMAKPSWTLP